MPSNIVPASTLFVEGPAELVPLIAELQSWKIDFLHIGLYPGTRGGAFHSHDVNVVPPYDAVGLASYAAQHTDHENFVLPLVHRGVVRQVFHYDPRKTSVDAYKERAGFRFRTRTVRTEYEPCIGGHRLRWRCGITGGDGYVLYPVSRSIDKASKLINGSDNPLVVSISLDAIHALYASMGDAARELSDQVFAGTLTNGFRAIRGEPRVSTVPLLGISARDYNYHPEQCGEDDYAVRASRISHFLRTLRPADMVVISRAKDPIPTAPLEEAERLEEIILGSLKGA